MGLVLELELSKSSGSRGDWFTLFVTSAETENDGKAALQIPTRNHIHWESNSHSLFFRLPFTGKYKLLLAHDYTACAGFSKANQQTFLGVKALEIELEFGISKTPESLSVPEKAYTNVISMLTDLVSLKFECFGHCLFSVSYSFVFEERTLSKRAMCSHLNQSAYKFVDEDRGSLTNNLTL